MLLASFAIRPSTFASSAANLSSLTAGAAGAGAGAAFGAGAGAAASFFVVAISKNWELTYLDTKKGMVANHPH